MVNNKMPRSEIGAEAAWRGFTSQTKYIASRLIDSKDNYLYYPE